MGYSGSRGPIVRRVSSPCRNKWGPVGENTFYLHPTVATVALLVRHPKLPIHVRVSPHPGSSHDSHEFQPDPHGPFFPTWPCPTLLLRPLPSANFSSGKQRTPGATDPVGQEVEKLGSRIA